MQNPVVLYTWLQYLVLDPGEAAACDNRVFPDTIAMPLSRAVAPKYNIAKTEPKSAGKVPTGYPAADREVKGGFACRKSKVVAIRAKGFSAGL